MSRSQQYLYVQSTASKWLSHPLERGELPPRTALPSESAAGPTEQRLFRAACAALTPFWRAQVASFTSHPISQTV